MVLPFRKKRGEIRKKKCRLLFSEGGSQLFAVSHVVKDKAADIVVIVLLGNEGAGAVLAVFYAHG